MNLRTTHFIGALIILVASGVGHGMWTHRWSNMSAAESGKDLLAAQSPIGDWSPGAFLTVREQDMPKGSHIVSRRFTNEKLGKSVTVSVAAGVPGVVAAHTPDVCFLGVGYKLKNPPSKQTLPLADGGSVTYYVADFEKTTATGVEAIRVRWAWSAEGEWVAPDYPRLLFAKSQASLPVLYKLYIAHNIENEDLTKTDAYRNFAADLALALGKIVRN